MNIDVNGYMVEGLHLVEKDGSSVLLVDRWGSLDLTMPTIKDTLNFIVNRIKNGKGLEITGWTYDEDTGMFVGALKKNKREAVSITAVLSRVIKRRVNDDEAKEAIFQLCP